ncbi:MAG: pathogenicity locus [Fimbriimonadaceae bacterium]|nr:pathogenicity locus [Chitinophagales bacterium]
MRGSNQQTKNEIISELIQIPGVGKSIATDLFNIGIKKIEDLKNHNPQELYQASNQFAGIIQDRCLLYVFRCAVYFASHKKHDPEKLKWWNWVDKDAKLKTGKFEIEKEKIIL